MRIFVSRERDAPPRGEPVPEPAPRHPGPGPEPLVEVVPDGQAEDDRNGHFQAQSAVSAQIPEECSTVLFVGHVDKPLLCITVSGGPAIGKPIRAGPPSPAAHLPTESYPRRTSRAARLVF